MQYVSVFYVTYEWHIHLKSNNTFNQTIISISLFIDHWISTTGPQYIKQIWFMSALFRYDCTCSRSKKWQVEVAGKMHRRDLLTNGCLNQLELIINVIVWFDKYNCFFNWLCYFFINCVKSRRCLIKLYFDILIN